MKRKQCNFSRKTRLREALGIEQNLSVSLLAAKTKREIVVLGTLRDKPEVISSTGTFFNFILPSSHFAKNIYQRNIWQIEMLCSAFWGQKTIPGIDAFLNGTGFLEKRGDKIHKPGIVSV